MTLFLAGEKVEYVVTFLEMTTAPAYPRPSLPSGPPTALIAADTPPVWYFLSLYDAVGADLEWNDQHKLPREQVRAFIQDPKVTLYTLLRTGWPAGFFILDARTEGTCDLAYFGLVPEVIGQGLGRYLLQTAIHASWDIPGVMRVTLNTNSLDHPRALPLYQKAGFEPCSQETHSRILSRPREIHN